VPRLCFGCHKTKLGAKLTLYIIFYFKYFNTIFKFISFEGRDLKVWIKTLFTYKYVGAMEKVCLTKHIHKHKQGALFVSGTIWLTFSLPPDRPSSTVFIRILTENDKAGDITGLKDQAKVGIFGASNCRTPSASSPTPST
jgi:hypothetical protein